MNRPVMKLAAWLSERPRPIACASLIVILLVGLVQTSWSDAVTLSTELPLLLQLSDRAAQARYVVGSDRFDMFAAADAMLSSRAAVLLVTAGSDPRHREYVTFHRALYQLAPRPVWWVNPATPDGTWESRWWIPSPLTADTLQKIARDKNISFLLFDDAPVPPGLGEAVALTPNARLVSLRAESITNHGSTSAAIPNLMATIVGLLVVLALGYALIAVARQLGYRAGRIEQIALAWQLGAGAVSILMLWLNALGLSLDAQITVITVSALGAVLATRFMRRAQPAAAHQQPAVHVSALPRIVPIVLTLLIALQLAFVALLAIGRPLTIWDAWVNWAMKARIIFLDHGITADVFADASRTVTQLDYPLLAPLVEAWTFAWAHSADDWLTGIPSLLFYASLLGVCYGLCRARMSLTHALLVVAALALLLPLSGLAASVFADLPLAVLAATAAAFTVRWIETRARGVLFIAALAAGLLPWTKREGLILVAALGLSLLIMHRRERAAWFATGCMVSAALVCAGPWYLFMAFSGVRNVAFAPFTLDTLQANLDRVPRIVWLELLRLLSADWNLLWLLAPLVSLAARGTHRQAADLLPVAALLYFGVMSSTYVFSDFVPYQQHVVSSVDRLLAHVAPLTVLWIAYRCAVAHKLKNNSK